ncbi:MAG TPA: site-specific integrase [Streptosporangiaceae bacterium]|nr:site-specific integrase [Streptosporangiaceae bacterium]HVB44875.1 site-specific integrase [Streptosporangiaceae bacterium]
MDVLGQVAAGTHTSDRNTRLGEYLDRWLGWREPELKPRTLESYREAFELYWKPALGHVRLADLCESHIRDVHAAMRKINTPAEAGDKSELLRRLLAVRATVPHLPGQRVRTAPLSKVRIKRVTAPLVTALNQCKALPVNPADGIGGKAKKTKPLVWTVARVEQWRKTGRRPAPVMVWTAAQCGAFLDSIEAERLYAAYHLVAYYGLRRGELANLDWSDLDLATRHLHVRDDVKSEDSDRVVVIDESTAAVLEAWREHQLFEALEWGEAWQDSGRVFTREDGLPLRAASLSEHLEVLHRRAGLPPVRFHDLRHGAATMLLTAGVEPKVISHILGHATVAFTMDVYTEVAEELAESAAIAIAAYVPRRARREAA